MLLNRFNGRQNNMNKCLKKHRYIIKISWVVFFLILIKKVTNDDENNIRSTYTYRKP